MPGDAPFCKERDAVRLWELFSAQRPGLIRDAEQGHPHTGAMTYGKINTETNEFCPNEDLQFAQELVDSPELAEIPEQGWKLELLEAVRIFNLGWLSKDSPSMLSLKGVYFRRAFNGEIFPVNKFQEAVQLVEKPDTREYLAGRGLQESVTSLQRQGLLKAFVTERATTQQQLIEIGNAKPRRFYPKIPDFGIVLEDGRVIEEQLHLRAIAATQVAAQTERQGTEANPQKRKSLHGNTVISLKKHLKIKVALREIVLTVPVEEWRGSATGAVAYLNDHAHKWWGDGDVPLKDSTELRRLFTNDPELELLREAGISNDEELRDWVTRTVARPVE